jgi:hypothetical protein
MPLAKNGGAIGIFLATNRTILAGMRVLGVTCSPKSAFLSLAEDQAIVAAGVSRIDVASQYEASEEMLSTLDEIRRALEGLRPDRVVVLKPELNQRMTYDQFGPRIALETLVRLATVQAHAEIEVMARPTVRSRLGLSKSGSLASRVAEVVPDPVGKYWREGRGIAALAALAGGGT